MSDLALARALAGQRLREADIARLLDVPEDSLHDPDHEAARQQAEAEREAYVAYLRAWSSVWEARSAVKVRAVIQPPDKGSTSE